MPVIVKSEEIHPYLPSLGSFEAIAPERAAHQDIRPLEIAILNLMADKVATEKQLAKWLGHTPLQVQLTFVATDRYMGETRAGRESRNTPSEHIRKFYKSFSEVKNRKFDGLIVTGVNALQPRVTDEVFWDEVAETFRWSETNAFSSLFLCWGAKAALKYFHDIESVKGEAKTWGLFEHRRVSDRSDLLFGFPDRFSIPVSRWKNPDPKAIAACKQLEIVAASAEAGPNILTEPAAYETSKVYPRRVYVLSHPEYDTDTLHREYLRDCEKSPAVPLHYYANNDPHEELDNKWRFTGFLYTNWVNSIYDATPYDLNDIPRPFGTV
ncbi:MAG: homoserine O-succinyltransferase [Alphaproteobacteria bacterium]|nr:homoserine O-succinyltransferase [Alphaproteobacteria bacterium]